MELLDWRNPAIHPIFRTVTRIRFPEQDGHATGFYYNSGDITYLITNKHVLEIDADEDDEDGEDTEDEMDYCETIRIFTRAEGNLGDREYHDVSLQRGPANDWYIHPIMPEVDIAAIPLDFELDSVNPRIGISKKDDSESSETPSLAFDSDTILSEKGRVIAGDRAQIVGYPGYYVDQQHGFPVIRSAIISTQYGFPYKDKPVFLTDATMHSGTSGSPVLAGPTTLIVHNGITLSGAAYRLLGVHSSTITQPLAEEDRKWLNLNEAWYAELIENIIQLNIALNSTSDSDE